MLSRALIVAAGLLAVACFACVPAIPPPPPPPPPVGPRLASCPALDTIAMLPDQYVGKSDPQNFVPPSNLSSVPNGMSGLIKAALDRAPDFFQKRICALNGIYIEPSGDSWGLRNPAGNRYIALSAALWPQAGQPQRLSDYNTGVVWRLLGWTLPTFTAMPTDPSHDPAMTILAVMAHEYGHVLFYDTFVPTWGKTPDYNVTDVDEPNGFCGGHFFDQSWDLSSIPLEPVYWRRFDQIVAYHQSDDFQIGDFQGYAAGSTVGQFYDGEGATAGNPNSTARWASLLAGFAPDHDFIETFELFVLMNSATPLRSLEINIPGYGKSDIPKTCSSRQRLVTKLTCMQAFCPSCRACP